MKTLKKHTNGSLRIPTPNSGGEKLEEEWEEDDVGEEGGEDEEWEEEEW